MWLSKMLHKDTGFCGSQPPATTRGACFRLWFCDRCSKHRGSSFKPRVNPAPGENRAYPANGISFSDELAMICTQELFGDC